MVKVKLSRYTLSLTLTFFTRLLYFRAVFRIFWMQFRDLVCEERVRGIDFRGLKFAESHKFLTVKLSSNKIISCAVVLFYQGQSGFGLIFLLGLSWINMGGWNLPLDQASMYNGTPSIGTPKGDPWYPKRDPTQDPWFILY